MSEDASNEKEIDYSDTPEGWANRWKAEISAAREYLERWHKTAEKCVDRYLDDKQREGERLSLYAASVNTREAMLYGNTPKVEVSRRNDDAQDDVARVGALILERILNADIARDEEAFPRALGSCLKDWLIPGFANQRLRYVRKTTPTEEVPAQMDAEGNEVAPAVPAGEELESEDVETVYVYWRDQLWSPARTYAELRWWAFRALLSQRTAEKTFGERLPLKNGGDGTKDDRDQDREPKTPWARAEVWEIWDLEERCVWWYCEGVPHVLQPKGVDAAPNGGVPDPLGLKGFWPFPEPLFSNLTTSKLVPRPDYAMAQDLYQAVDDETNRIAMLRDSIKAVGVYDKTVGEFSEILEGSTNKVVPAKNFAALSEKGGIAQAIAWLPLEAFVAALDKLRELRREDMELLYQVTGDSDIMRGQAIAQGATATEQAIKAKFASIRGDQAQKRFASFASDSQRIRGEIICKHFDAQTIFERANVQGMPQEDQRLAPQAIELLKSGKYDYRIVVKPEAISLTDYAANKQEALDILGVVATYIQSLGQLAMQAPMIAPQLLQILQAFVARVKGGDAIEGILDEAIRNVQQAALQPKPPPPPDPKLQAAQVKAGAEQFKAKAQVAQTSMDMQKAKTEHLMDMQKLEAEMRADAMKSIQPPGGVPA